MTVKKQILIALDGSANSHYAFLWAVEHFIHAERDRVVLVHVQPILHVDPRIPYIDPHKVIEEMNEQNRQKAHGILRFHGNLLQERGIEVQGVVVHGDPREELIKKAEELQVDTLVLGARSASLLCKTVLGSVASSVLHHAHCNVLTVPLPKKQLLE